jgi:tRNA threonylcarbamoyladenosine biosynthesis protein TsaB
MIVLGMDTSTLVASVALVENGRVVAEMRGDKGARGSDLLLMIDAVCVGAAIGAHDLDAIAIGAGPGSFTGLRIGMATAKGIAFAAKCPLWAVSSLAALAHEELEGAQTATVVAILDARRGEVYAGIYHRDGDRTVLVGDERVMPPAELGAFMPPNARVTGDALDVIASFPVHTERTPSGVAVAQLALAGAHVDVLVSGVPSYIRPSEAEVKYPDGVPGALRKR